MGVIGVCAGAIGAVAVMASGAYSLLRVFASQVAGLKLSRNRVRLLQYSAVTQSASFRRNKFVESPGEFALSWAEGRGQARVGGVVKHLPNGTVERSISDVRGEPLRGGTSADWRGQYFFGPDDLGMPFTNVELTTENGAAPAWVFANAAGSTDVWIVHVHGLRVTRLSPLRGVSAAREANVTSLVISYRGDVGGPASGAKSSSLGADEWRDVEPAIEYAVAHGAKRIVLMGWSMGAEAVLLASERSKHRSAIAGLILVSPVTSWRSTIMFGARAANVPGWVGRCVTAVLSSSRGASMVGLSKAIDFDALEWCETPGRLSVPALVLHSAGDDEVPFMDSCEFARLNPKQVTLVQLPDSLHTMEWNRSPAAFEEAMYAWLARL